MYKVILIDPDPSVLDWLSGSIPWQELECGLAGTAKDEAEGMNLVAELHPDLMITDIAMENPDGLGMVTGIKAEHPDIRVTILTVHRDFDYAQEAIRIGVDRFLVKPSSGEEIKEAVRFMVQKRKEYDQAKEAVFHPVERVLPPASKRAAKAALKYIEEHYQEKIHLKEVAQYAYVSRWYISRLLNEETGKSFPDLVNMVRISKAKELLMDSSCKIGDIAGMVGFTDKAHFARAFRRETGTTPGDFRKFGG